MEWNYGETNDGRGMLGRVMMRILEMTRMVEGE